MEALRSFSIFLRQDLMLAQAATEGKDNNLELLVLLYPSRAGITGDPPCLVCAVL